MGENKHTPGHWGVEQPMDHCLFVVANPCVPVADWVFVASCDWDGMPANQVRANANLIAAAPELYEALEEVLRWDAYPNASCRMRIEAALAKANGKRPPLPPTARCE